MNTNIKIQLRYPLFSILLFIVIIACKPSKHIQDDEYLVNKVVVDIDNKDVDTDELKSVIKQSPNNKLLGFWRFKLGAYNAIDTAKIGKRKEKKIARIDKVNARKKNRVLKRNKRRIQKTRNRYNRKVERFKKKGKDTTKLTAKFNPVYYYPKEYSKTFREWIKYSIGEEPVILDTSKTNATVKQMEIFLKKSGYYYAEIKDSTVYDSTKQFAKIIYQIKTGKPYIIDTIIYLESSKGFKKHIDGTADNRSVALRMSVPKIEVGMKLNTNILDEERQRISSSMLDDSFYGTNKELFYYEVDTTLGDFKAALKIGLKKRTLEMPDGTLAEKSISSYHVSKVFFHINDTSYFKGNFADTTAKLGLNVKDDKNRFNLLDTSIMIEDQAYPLILYNGKMIVKPSTLDNQNFLEFENWYKDYYITRTFERLNNLGIFRSITPVVSEDFEREGNWVKVDYYLTPAKRQSVTIEPKATHSDAVLGVSATISYVNKNLFRGAERFKVDVSGGFQYQPPLSAEDKENQNFGFNTYEFGPALSLKIPKFFPFKSKNKRAYPETDFVLSYNFQSRPEYERHQSSAKFAYTSYEQHKSRVHTLTPMSLSINQIETSEEFDQRIEELNDEFLKNRFLDHFTLKSNYTFKFNNKPLVKPTHRHLFLIEAGFDFAGNLLRLTKIGSNNPDDNGSYTIAGIPYSQFFKVDVDLKYYNKLNAKNTHSLNYRIQAGVGVPYGNSPSLPFDYSFYAGGSNSVRAFPARSLGPGGFLDTLNTASRVGDFRLTGTIEYRFDIFSYFKGAIFTDFGNIWLLKADPLRPNAELSEKFLEQISWGAGIGLRLDFSFFIFRLDVGVPIYNPFIPKGERWLFSKTPQYDAIREQYKDQVTLRKPFAPTFNIAIGYPF